MKQAATVAGISVETLRKAKRVCDALPDGRALLMSGDYSVDELYRKTKNDHAVGISLKMPKELRAAIKSAASDHDMTMNDFSVAILKMFIDKYLSEDRGQ